MILPVSPHPIGNCNNVFCSRLARETLDVAELRSENIPVWKKIRNRRHRIGVSSMAYVFKPILGIPSGPVAFVMSNGLPFDGKLNR